MYKKFKRVEFKKYLQVMQDSFKFRSGTHGLKEELGRHRGREVKSECIYLVWC